MVCCGGPPWHSAPRHQPPRLWRRGGGEWVDCRSWTRIYWSIIDGIICLAPGLPSPLTPTPSQLFPVMPRLQIQTCLPSRRPLSRPSHSSLRQTPSWPGPRHSPREKQGPRSMLQSTTPALRARSGSNTIRFVVLDVAYSRCLLEGLE
jgi:hypothetical protein